MADQLDQAYQVSIGREAEILEDLQYARLRHGVKSEAYRTLLQELTDQEKRTEELGAQLERKLVQRLQQSPEWPAIRQLSDDVLELYRKRPELFRRQEGPCRTG